MDYLIINAKKVFLRPLSYGDAATLFSYRSNPEVANFQLWKPATISDAIRFIKRARFQTELINSQWNQFAICLRTTNKMIGDIGLLLNDRKAEIGFTISPNFQKKGMAFQAVTSLINYLFQKHNVHLIIAYTDPKNVPSIGLLKKIGFYLDSSNIQRDKDNTDLCFILNKD
jgi:RimJ/RimL family protein N-acetyltransferase